jgi:excisionase family DNA binding protein
MRQAQSASPVLTKPEAAARARVHLRTLERRIEDGTGPRVTRIGRRVLIREDHLAEWLDRCASVAKETTA